MTSETKLSDKDIPKDLGLNIGSKLEAFWTNVRDATKIELENAKNSVLLQSEVLAIAEKNIEKEKRV